MDAGTLVQDSEQGRPGRPSFFYVARKSLGALRRAQIESLAAEAAYFSSLAIGPFLIFLVTLAALLNQFTDLRIVTEIQLAIWRLAPGSTVILLNNLVENAVARIDAGPASFGFVSAAAIALWSASRAIQTLLKGFDRVYQVENRRPYFRRRIVSMVLAVLMTVIINVSVMLFLFGGTIGRWLAGLVGMGTVFRFVWDLLVWPLGIILMMALLAVFYYIGPSVKTGFRCASPGAIVATSLWVLVVLGFRVWLLFIDPRSIYGALGTFVLLLIFLYITSIVLVLGAAVNAVVEDWCESEPAPEPAES